MRIVLLGAPGAGKGTQAQFIAQKYHIPNISTGEILRKLIYKNTVLNKKIDYSMHSGKLISDDIITTLIRDRITCLDCKPGFILDGFPRTIVQAKMIEEEKIDIDYIIELKIPTKIILKRIQNRRTNSIEKKIQCLQNGNYPTNNSFLAERVDDKEKIVKIRLHEYEKFTIPLINYLKNDTKVKKFKYCILDGTKNIKNIHKDIKKILDVH
ncbi:MAG: nucleoside monophosphate kinase [Buchnera aphidicola (Schlechtendalia peitan)]